MPAFDLVSLAVLWCIGLLAVLHVINAKGAIRLALSGIVTVLILLVAGFFTYVKVEGYGSFVSEELSPKPIVAINEAISKKSRGAEGSLEAKSAEASKRYVASAVKIADEGISLASQIQTAKALSEGLSEPGRESAENRALAIRNSTSRVNSRATALFHPKSLGELHAKLVHASELLRLAGYALHAYTTIENAEERRAQFEESKRQAALARSEFSAYKQSIENLP